MTPDRFGPSETDTAVERLLIAKNGQKKTANDVFEVLVAMHHDSKARDLRLLSMVEDRDEVVAVIEADIQAVKDNCLKLHRRAPRRQTDPETENWSIVPHEADEELGDLRRAWRFLKWVVIVVGGTLLVAAGDQLSHRIWGT